MNQEDNILVAFNTVNKQNGFLVIKSYAQCNIPICLKMEDCIYFKRNSQDGGGECFEPIKLGGHEKMASY